MCGTYISKMRPSPRVTGGAQSPRSLLSTAGAAAPIEAVAACMLETAPTAPCTASNSAGLDLSCDVGACHYWPI
jgi:hypothetical protein